MLKSEKLIKQILAISFLNLIVFMNHFLKEHMLLTLVAPFVKAEIIIYSLS